MNAVPPVGNDSVAVLVMTLPDSQDLAITALNYGRNATNVSRGSHADSARHPGRTNWRDWQAIDAISGENAGTVSSSGSLSGSSWKASQGRTIVVNAVMIRYLIVCLAFFAAVRGAATRSRAGPDSPNGPSSPTNPYKPPLYWDVYEYHIVRQQESAVGRQRRQQHPRLGRTTSSPSRSSWRTSTGSRPTSSLTATTWWRSTAGATPRRSASTAIARRTRTNWEHDYAWWSAHLRERGMRLGMYENPLVVHVAPWDVTTKIVGTDIPVSSLSIPRPSARSAG
jgi:hypothetical protein